MPETLTWLHLSDADIGDPRHAPDAEHVLQTLAEDLTVMQNERGLHPDLVFFTGDAAFGDVPEAPLEHQYREVARFLDGVRCAFRPHIDKRRVFLVPGNHDVNRSQATEDQRAWLEHLLENGITPEDKIDELMRKASVQWQRYIERLDHYADFLRTSGYAHLLEDPQRLSYAVRVPVNASLGC